MLDVHGPSLEDIVQQRHSRDPGILAGRGSHPAGMLDLESTEPSAA